MINILRNNILNWVAHKQHRKMQKLWAHQREGSLLSGDAACAAVAYAPVRLRRRRIRLRLQGWLRVGAWPASGRTQAVGGLGRRLGERRRCRNLGGGAWAVAGLARRRRWLAQVAARAAAGLGR